MKYLFALAAVATLASAQSIPDLVSQIPSCADQCLVTDIPKVCPSLTDYACQCTPAHVSQLTSLLTPCVLSACGVEKALQLKSITDKICSIENAMGGGGSSAATSAAAATTAASMAMTSAAMMSTSEAVNPTAVANSIGTITDITVSSYFISTPSGVPTAFTGGAMPAVTAAPAFVAAAAALAWAL